ncbi:hypothetical protein BS78_08G134400 [Paspalum vaginatum]|nr:hypothetical protein BS78_08G134400 [Paspalum vaginatum]
MEAPWVILGRVLLGGPVPHIPDSRVEEAAAANEPHPVPDLAATVSLPPRVTIFGAGLRAHPDANNPDKYPYIIAAGRFHLLAHFAVAPFYGTYFENDPENTRLVLARHVRTDEGLATATAEQIPDRRTGVFSSIWNVGSVGLLSVHERYTIAELMVDQAGTRATLGRFESGQAAWKEKRMDCPLSSATRRWFPHGAVPVNSSVCWFDLSWGMLSCDLGQPEQELALNFLPLPGDRDLGGPAPADIHTKRGVTVTQDGRLGYVEIIPVAGQAPTVAMWTRSLLDDGWVMSYEMSFERIWDDASYTTTGLTRGIVPVLAVVSPENHEVVYFALEQHLFGVNVPKHRVEHCAGYRLTMPGPPQPASSRYVVAWNLPPAAAQAQALGMGAIDGIDAGQQAVSSSDSEDGGAPPECCDLFLYLLLSQAAALIDDKGQSELQPVDDEELQPEAIDYDYEVNPVLQTMSFETGDGNGHIMHG